MPYWSILCVHCLGEIVDALLECLPPEKRSLTAYQFLFFRHPGADLACPYCNGLVGFDDRGLPISPRTGWPVFRYARAQLELKKQADGVATSVPLAEWALRHRFINPGTHLPFVEYQYAEHAPLAEIVP